MNSLLVKTFTAGPRVVRQAQDTEKGWLHGFALSPVFRARHPTWPQLGEEAPFVHFQAKMLFSEHCRVKTVEIPSLQPSSLSIRK